MPEFLVLVLVNLFDIYLFDYQFFSQRSCEILRMDILYEILPIRTSILRQISDIVFKYQQALYIIHGY
jgi:hypothetical protein